MCASSLKQPKHWKMVDSNKTRLNVFCLFCLFVCFCFVLFLTETVGRAFCSDTSTKIGILC